MSSMTELFWDDELIEMAAGVQRKVHQPFKHRLNPLMIPEKWWEPGHVAPNAILYDEEEKIFKMWYRATAHPAMLALDNHCAYTAYATSKDGLHWERPELGIMDFAGRRDHSVVMVGDVQKNLDRQRKKGFICSVIRHPKPKDESEKYVCMYANMKKRGCYIGYSADGINWRCEVEPYWSSRLDPTGWGDDTVHQMIYDKHKEKWVTYRRIIPEESERMIAQSGDENWEMPERYYRAYGYADSDDLKTWENHQMILAADADDPAGDELYWLSCYNYEQVYLGYLCMFHMKSEDQGIDVQLVTSRNGIDFTRVAQRQVFIPAGPRRYYDYMVTVGWAAEPIIVDDIVHIYYEANNVSHDKADSYSDQKDIRGTICLATLWRDRFTSIETGPPEPCRLVTKPLVVKYPKLFINAATWDNGSIAVEILTRDWQVIEGFGAKDCSVINGDALAHPVCWKDNADMSKLIGKEVRIRYCMSNARIHSMTMDEDNRPLKKVTVANPLDIRATKRSDTLPEQDGYAPIEI